jgi:uncharacterized membrane protein
MSLAIAIDQIQRPTWWYENDRDQSKKLVVSDETIAMRKSIIAWLRKRGGKVSGIELQRHFGISNSQLWHYLNPLVEAGQVRKFKPRHDRSLLEAV